jgi:hypothetical protein
MENDYGHILHKSNQISDFALNRAQDIRLHMEIRCGKIKKDISQSNTGNLDNPGD